MTTTADVTAPHPTPTAPGSPGTAVWVRALRLYSVTASVIPVLFGLLLGFRDRDAFGLLLAFPTLLAGVSLHLGTNLINDVGDFQSGVDRPGGSAGSGVLVEGILTPAQVLRAAYGFFAVALVLGLMFLPLRGWPLLAIGFAGFMGGWGYTAGPKYKYLGLGDIGVFILMGTLMVLGGYLMMTGHLAWGPALASIPIGALVVAIIHANNLRDLKRDKEMGLQTVAVWLGPAGSVRYYALLVMGAYISLAGLIALRILPFGAAMALGSLPIAIKLIRAIAAATKADTLEQAFLVERTAQLHLLFGLAMIVGIALQMGLMRS